MERMSPETWAVMKVEFSSLRAVRVGETLKEFASVTLISLIARQIDLAVVLKFSAANSRIRVSTACNLAFNSVSSRKPSGFILPLRDRLTLVLFDAGLVTSTAIPWSLISTNLPPQDCER